MITVANKSFRKKNTEEMEKTIIAGSFSFRHGGDMKRAFFITAILLSFMVVLLAYDVRSSSAATCSSQPDHWCCSYPELSYCCRNTGGYNWCSGVPTPSTTTTTAATTTTTAATTTASTTTTAGTTTTTAVTTQMNNFCSTPPFISGSVTPNVMILLDSSISMGYDAYVDNTTSNLCTSSSAPCYRFTDMGTYPTYKYYGYFDPDFWYQYDNSTNNGYFYPTNPKTGSGIVGATTKAANEWDGSFLNWLTMRRADVLKKALTGGRYDTATVSGGYKRLIGLKDTYTYASSKYIQSASAYAPYSGEFYAENQAPGGSACPWNTSGSTGEAGCFRVYQTNGDCGSYGTGCTSANLKKSSPATYNIRVRVPDAQDGLVQKFGSKVRLGYAQYSSTNNGAKVYNNVSTSSYTSVAGNIDNMTPTTSTPLAESLWSVVGYFAQVQTLSDTLATASAGATSTRGPLYNTGDYTASPGGTSDPYYNYTNALGSTVYAPCAKSFVILLTDGEPTNDGSLPTTLGTNDYAGGKSSFNCVNSISPGTCPSVTVGSTTFPASTLTPDLAGMSGRTAGLEDVALYMHTNDLRKTAWSNAAGTGDTDNQTLSLFTVFAFGNGSTFLKYATINGSFKDLNNNNRPDLQSEWDSDSDGVPDYYFDASEGDAIESGIESAFNVILSTAASGTSASVLANKSKQGANILQAAFYPQKPIANVDLTWIGYLHNLWLYNSSSYQNIREETDGISSGVYKLNLQTDKIVVFNYTNDELTIERYSDSDGNGAADSSTPDSTTTMDSLKSIWEAGKLLFSRTDSETAADKRMIYVYDNSTVTGATSALTEFTTTNKSLFQSYMGSSTSLNGTSNFNDVIKYIRGTDKTGLRNRTTTIDSTVNTWKLGDIIYSTPALESYDNASTDYTVIFAGANDGMLHAFKLGKQTKNNLGSYDVGALEGTNLGSELWAFIPRHSLPYLRYLADPNYCHLYYADLQPYIYKPTAAQKILIGGMRLGGACGCPTGTNCTDTTKVITQPPIDTCSNPAATNGSCIGFSSYFALDITYPASPKFLWEFSHPQLGFSLSGPAIVKRSTGTFVVFLNGPQINHGDYTGYSDQNLQIFVLKLNSNMTIDSTFNSSTGYYIKDVGSAFANSYGGRLFTTGVDFGGDGYTDFLPFGYVQNTGITTADASGPKNNLKGGVMGIKIADNPTTWGSSGTCSSTSTQWVLYENAVTFVNRPVTSKVVLGKCFGSYYMYFGTGRYMTATETYGASTAKTDYISASKFDNCDNYGCCTGTFNSLASFDNQTCPGTPGAKSGWKKQLCMSSDSSNPTATVAGDDSSMNCTPTVSDSDYGTSYLFERDISDPTLDTPQNIVMFTSTRPSADLCAVGGKSRAWSLNCATGQATTDSTCSGYTIPNAKGTLFLQLSTAQIKQLTLGTTSFNPSGYSGWFSGITPESAPPFVSPASSKTGLIHWIER